MSGSGYEIVLTPPARRAVVDGLPEAVAAAVIEFITTTLLEDPQRVGKPLRGDLSSVWSARRGTFRVLYRIQEQSRELVVLRIQHRRDVYRRLTADSRDYPSPRPSPVPACVPICAPMAPKTARPPESGKSPVRLLSRCGATTIHDTQRCGPVSWVDS